MAVAACLRAVQAGIERLREELRTDDAQDIPDTQELVLSYSSTAQELRQAYDPTLRMTNNLVPDEDLTKPQG